MRVASRGRSRLLRCRCRLQKPQTNLQLLPSSMFWPRHLPAVHPHRRALTQVPVSESFSMLTANETVWGLER